MKRWINVVNQMFMGIYAAWIRPIHPGWSLIIFSSLLIGLWVFKSHNWWVLAFYFFFIPLSHTFKLKFSHVFLVVAISLLVSFIIKLLPLNYPSFWLSQWWSLNWFHDQLVNWVNQHYRANTAQLINVLVFNEKDYHTDLLTQLSLLNVLQLVSISGLHFVILYKIITKIFSFHERIAHVIALSFLLTYWVLINFSYPGFRALISLLVIPKLTTAWYHKLSLIGLISLTYHPHIYWSYAFLLSFGVVFLIYLVNQHHWKTSLVQFFVINLVIWFYVSLLFLPIHHRFYYFLPFNAWLLTPIIIPLYLYFLVSWLILWLSPLANWLSDHFFWMIHQMNLNKWYGYIGFWNSQWSVLILYFGMILLLLVIHWFQVRKINH